MELMQASNQWLSRPADERFTSLDAMLTHFRAQRALSKALTISTHGVQAIPSEDNKGMLLRSVKAGTVTVPTHHAFNQLAQRADAPASYLRKLPAPMAADCINYGLRYNGSAEDVGLLLRREDHGISTLAVTGPRYGRIWNADITKNLIDRFGDGTGRDTDWSVPGCFGQPLDSITKENTTLFAGDRDMFIFLADETNRITIPNRRKGSSGSLARGFFVWNSEVGSSTFGISTFLFDYVCDNRIVWGATQQKTITMRHTSAAPDRFVEEIAPALQSYAHASSLPITDAVKKAQAARIDKAGADVNDWLAKRFSKSMVAPLQAVAMAEEGRPIETLWDATCAVTAYAKGLKHQDARVELERKGGELLDLVM